MGCAEKIGQRGARPLGSSWSTSLQAQGGFLVKMVRPESHSAAAPGQPVPRIGRHGSFGESPEHVGKLRDDRPAGRPGAEQVGDLGARALDGFERSDSRRSVRCCATRCRRTDSATIEPCHQDGQRLRIRGPVNGMSPAARAASRRIGGPAGGRCISASRSTQRRALANRWRYSQRVGRRRGQPKQALGSALDREFANPPRWRPSRSTKSRLEDLGFAVEGRGVPHRAQ